jgi:IS605 OrfB family transposase
VSERKSLRKAKAAKGYATQAERFQKLRRVQHLRGELARVEHDQAAGVVHVVEGGKRLATTRHHLDNAGLTEAQWRQRWDTARWRIRANGSPDEPFGNLTITVTPAGQVSIRLPKPLEHLANAPRGRYVLSGAAVFSHRGEQWAQRITGGNSVSYTITRQPGRAGVYLTAAWAIPALPYWAGRDDCNPGGDVFASGPVVGVDLNDGHLAVRRLDEYGNPVGAPVRIDVDLTGSSSRRDAQVRHAITALLHYTRRHGISTIAVEDLNFADARATGRETMGRGARGKRFRRTVSGIPTAVFRNRLAAMTTHAGIELLAVNPAYSSIWGGQHWQQPYTNVTRHQAAATVIGRRAQGLSARRRTGVTPQRPEDRPVRATGQTRLKSPTATGGRHETGTLGITSRRPTSTRKRQPGRATVTPAQLANNGQLHL